jgi:hypothetical protein
VNMESVYGETENRRIDFDKANSFDDIDAIIDQIIAAIRMRIEKCQVIARPSTIDGYIESITLVDLSI